MTVGANEIHNEDARFCGPRLVSGARRIDDADRLLGDNDVDRVNRSHCGIPDEHRDRIFDPFFTTKAIGKGLGLGLSISYGIVRDLGGQIHVSNLPEGGTEIVVELPRHHPKSSFEHA